MRTTVKWQSCQFCALQGKGDTDALSQLEASSQQAQRDSEAYIAALQEQLGALQSANGQQRVSEAGSIAEADAGANGVDSLVRPTLSRCSRDVWP